MLKGHLKIMGWLIEWNSKDVIRVDVAKLREV